LNNKTLKLTFIIWTIPLLERSQFPVWSTG